MADSDSEIRGQTLTMMESAWRPEGFSVPNPHVYPFQWLWDSCFHSIIWAELGDQRATTELESALANQDETGFVPHLTYLTDPDHHRSFWARSLTSSITQPPMYGHTAAELVRRGFGVSDETMRRATLGLHHLLNDRQRTEAGLVPVFHPWETGCDDSLRWDHWRTNTSSIEEWRNQKGDLVRAIDFDGGRHPTGSSLFAVGSVGFNALIVWNVRELASVGVGTELLPLACELAEAVVSRWNEAAATWIDDGPHAESSGGARTADSMLALLVDPRPIGFAQLTDPVAFSAPFGSRGVHRGEPGYQPDVYWRGGSWPQLSYLLALAARDAGFPEASESARRGLRAGAIESGMSEYWHPESGKGLGARPQSWAGLAILR